jgi:ribosomal-protein-alanine N-acetyltransferase
MAQSPLVTAAGSTSALRGPRMDLRYRRLTPRHVHELVAFLERLATGGDGRLFHPHPFTPEAVAAIAAPGSRDEYVVVTAGRQGPVVAYGMLRGWEEGFTVPSLGIAVDRQWRGHGVGRRLVSHLHAIATSRGAANVRLKVYRSNTAAVALYRSFGYQFQPHSPDEWLGFVSLPVPHARAA